MVSDNIKQIREQIAAVCRRANRNPQEITLIGVTKYADASKIKEAVEAGVQDIGENKVQVAQDKFPVLEQLGVKVKKHLIGHLQSNKAKYVVKLFDLVQSVDSLKLAEEIDKQAAKINKVMDIFVQINVAGEEQKHGVSKDEGVALVESIAPLKNIKIRGLMTMAPYTEDKELVRKTFRDLRVIRDEVVKKSVPNVEMKYLSMGMSGDFDIAIEEGSNMIRIGTAMFK